MLHCPTIHDPLTLLASIPWGGARVWAIVLWIGLGLLSVALVLLTRTRWGQAKPLHKCVALSVFAHVLLIAYAYGTKLFMDAPPPPAEEVFQLSMVESSSTDDSTEDPSVGLKPWEKTESDTFVPPDPNVDRSQWTEVGNQEDLNQPDDVEPPNLVQEEPDLPGDRATAPPVPELPELATDQSAAPPARAGAELIANQPQDSTDVQQGPELPGELSELPAPRPQEVDPAPPVARSISDESLELDVEVPEADQHPQPLANTDENTARMLPLSVPAVSPQQVVDQVVSAPPMPRKADGRPVPATYRMRLDANRRDLFIRMGGTRQALEAIDRSLEWLAANQEADGRWDADRFGSGRESRHETQSRDGAGTDADTGISGLALLAFLSAGHTHFEGDYREAVQHGLEFILGEQARNGSLAGRSRLYASMYCHGMATLAISEAYAMTGDERIRPYLQRAINYSVNAQNSAGGWRYQPRDPTGDMSQFGWQVMALVSARQAGIQVPDATFKRMEKFLNSCSTGQHRVLAGYRPGHPATRTMSSEAMVCRAFLGKMPTHDATQYFAEFIDEELPGTTEEANLYYWYYATLALYQLQTESWQQWSTQVQKTLLATQHQHGAQKGSWDADTRWGSYGGRVYSTAMATLTLEVYLRYLPMLR